MSADDRSELIQIITEAIQRHARGDLRALAENIVTEIENHGYEIGTATRAKPRLVESAQDAPHCAVTTAPSPPNISGRVRCIRSPPGTATFEVLRRSH